MVTVPEALESAVCGDERWDLAVYRTDRASGGIVVVVFHDECGGKHVEACYWEAYRERSRVATHYIGSEAAHAVSDAVYRLANKLRVRKDVTDSLKNLE
jgi:hypothetical protein